MARKKKISGEKKGTEKIKFFDINTFHATEGLLIFPMSMSRIANVGQNAKTYMKYARHFYPKVRKTSPRAKFGINFIYGDFLYLYSKEKSQVLKKRFMGAVTNHYNSFMKELRGEPHFIQEAFAFNVWNQLYLDCPNFAYNLKKLKEIFKRDKVFQKYLKEDFKKLPKGKYKFDENQIDFFLEEHLMLYFISKGKVRLRNDFIRDLQKWTLVAYPGKPLKAHIYLHQKNFFEIDNKENPYQNCWYNLEDKKLYCFDNIDLENYNLN